MRKLASIKQISEILPIAGKDRIVLAIIDGWSVIVKKDEFKVGDKCIYAEIDSVFPETEQFEFLRKNHFRIKTMKMGGVVSQGICFPLDILPVKTRGTNSRDIPMYINGVLYTSTKNDSYDLDEDVTEVLGITQYQATMDVEPVEKEILPTKHYPEFLMRMKWFRKLVLPKKQERGFPSFISKTDETRIQNMPFILKDKGEWVVTEKVDGCVLGDTLITTDKGQLKIKDIVNKKLNINILTYNEELKICEYKPVTDWHQILPNKKRYKIGIGFRGKGNRAKFIECTDNHQFLTTQGWKRADELSIEDKVMHLNKKYPSELNEILLGCLLGDSSFNGNSESGNYRTVNFNHSIQQSEYFKYKEKLFGNYFIREKNVKSGYGSEMLRGKLVTNLGVLKLANNMCLVDNKKTISEQWVNNLTPISLAFWFMDDGTLINRNDESLRCRAIINTQGFSFEEHNLLQSGLKNKFGITTSIGDKETYKGYILIFDADNTEKLCSLIAPYICESMKYKIPKKYENQLCFFESFTFNEQEGVVETSILSIQEVDIIKENIKFVYDLEVKDNHNYFAKNILVHNCSGTFCLKRNKSKIPFIKDKFEYIVCSRNLRLWNKDSSSYWRVSDRYDIENALKQIIGDDDWVAIQGECVAPNVQGNKYKVTEPDLYVFNIINPNGRLDSEYARDICNALCMKFVPILDEDYILPDTVNEVLYYAHGQSKLYDTLREGLVFRSKDGKQSFKAVDPLFLLKYDE